VVVVVTVVGGTVGPTDRVYVWLSVIGGTDESKTCALNAKLPAAVGVPVIWPVVALIVNPCGRSLDVQVYGPVPPEASSWAE
jgi:hypothetical protein